MKDVHIKSKYIIMCWKPIQEEMKTPQLPQTGRECVFKNVNK